MEEIVAYRLSGWDTPFWIGPNRFARRFNKGNSGPVQYWSLHPLTPWAEVLRGQGIKTEMDAQEFRQRVWAAIIVTESIEEIDYDNAPDFDLEPHQLVSDDYGACQDFGEKCLTDEDMPDAIEVPSAALPGTTNLVLFGPRIRVSYLADPISIEDSPTAIAAEAAQPPVELLPMVRHFGDLHDEYQAWSRGRPFPFKEPTVRRV